MRTKLLIGALAFGLVATGPAISAQTTSTVPDGSQPMPGQTEDPADPNPMPDPSNPTPPMTDPLPPEMPMPAGQAQDMPPMQTPGDAPMVMDRSMPAAPPATMPSAGANEAVSGSTTGMMMTPQPATKVYPPCSRTLQDNCRNPGEGPKRVKKPR